MSGPRRWRVTRRGFLIGAGLTGGALALGVAAGLPEAQYQIARRFEGASSPATVSDDPTLWFELLPDNRLRLFLPKVEMGQGVHTALGQIAAEELLFPLERIELVQATTRVGPGDSSGTQGSSSVSSVYTPLRQAAATLREMLRAAAAERLALPPAQLVARNGSWEDRKNPASRIAYGDLLAEGVEWEVPEGEVSLLASRDFGVIGQSVARVDIPAKVTGQAIYGFDARLPGMLYGAMVRAPTLAGTLRRLRNADAVRSMAGVVAVVEGPGWAGVVAHSRVEAWAARDALEGEWESGRRWQQAEIDEIVSVGGRGGVTIQREGDTSAALREGTLLEAEYRTPFAAHAPLEPQAALADVRPEGVRLWVSTQMASRTAERVAAELEREVAEVEVLPTFLGGGFGRKEGWTVAIEAARLSRAVAAPVHVGWTRSEEMRHSFYRPPTHHLLRATVQEGGEVAAMEHQQASGDVLFTYFPEIAAAILGADLGAWRGATIPYAIPNRRAVAWRRKVPVPTGPWRGLGLLANTFALESFVDEVAHASGTDPLAFRLARLPAGIEGERMRAVLEAAAAAGGWATPAPAGRARGIALSRDVGTVVAAVVELSVERESGTVRVHRVTAAMDCGLVINPDGARAQMEGNIIWGLGSALLEEMRIVDGAVEAGNFDGYPLLTMREAPDIEALLLPSPIADPRGVGEPPIGPVAAAVGNALFALTGVRLRELPFSPERVRAALV